MEEICTASGEEAYRIGVLISFSPVTCMSVSSQGTAQRECDAGGGGGGDGAAADNPTIPLFMRKCTVASAANAL